MSSDISPKAEISPKAKIGDGCKIFPFVYIEDDVEIGDNCVIFPFVSILSGTKMGKDNKVHQCTVLGAQPQDFAFTGEKTQLIIGNNNIIRENVVINRATHSDGQTVIGNDNFLMEGTHISHDTKIGNRNVFGYGTKIAGDCEIGNGVIFSSSVIENAGTRVGNLAMIQAGTTFSKDVPPFIIAGGTPVGYGGPNNTMMTAWNIDEKIQKHVANAYRLVFHGQNSVFDAVLQINDQVPDSTEIRSIVDFINASQKGIISKM
ncbi:MAG: acyl-ACP--UDP-N-acetylglucosamine O-acyltransferase [Prevotella sp.]|nr:acyl-ACP--UDP-N-acetylglucosamine O-acyltransferase [Prevotella sp.]